MNPILIYDGRCGFCKIWINYWKLRTGDRVDYAPSQEVAAQYPQIPASAFSEAVQLVRPDGSYVSGARAVYETLGMEKTYEASRLLAGLSEAVYGFVARHRNFFYQATRFTFGTHIEPARYEWTQWIFLRLLAIVYGIAFASLAVQVIGLMGADGILPIHEYLSAAAESVGRSRFLEVPTIFWISATDPVLHGACWAGVVLAALVFTGRFSRLWLILLFVLYLSFSSTGQDFLSFQWDALLLEAGFLAIFLGRTPVVIWLFRWLVFRLYFLSGAVKLLSGDPTWRNLTALNYHFHTQPLPVRLAWYADKLPEPVLHGLTFLTLAIELGAPFLIFAPRRIRIFGASLMIGVQILILLTGNYAFFNLLTIALCLFLFDDQAWRRPFVRSPRPARIGPAILAAIIVSLGLVHMFETYNVTLPEPLPWLTRATAPFEIVNSYGLFAVMTTTRPEIIVEGSNDGQNWEAYEFRYKPGDLDRAPRWVAPHQPRLDWQMWFAALGNYRSSPWFTGFALRLLQNSPPALALLERNPFPDFPPRYVRARVYEYTFTDWATRRATGAWWQRRLLGEYLPAIGLRSTQ
ncbi:MAG: lipase maturation factor family protein [Bryobacteraceae bacterium]|jgi:predicted DCC family thiol-disulfide oxidoreductase YuxK